MARTSLRLTRRHFLSTAGKTGLGVIVLSAGRALVAPRPILAAQAPAAGEVREIELVAKTVRWELAPGKTVSAMAYNGQIPGPEIRVREGERVRVLFRNELSQPTTIHWHGVSVPFSMDGLPGITQAPVPPGGKFVYEFEARPSGTRWYHTHYQEHRQMDLGLAGPLIIEPAGPEPFPFDRELTLVLDDWATGTGPVVRNARSGMGGMMGRQHMGGTMGGGMMGGGPSATGGHEHNYDTFTINGKAHPATEPLRVKEGERVRLRLINASADHTHVIRLAGHRLHVTHTDGNPLVQPVEVDAVPIAPSERYDVFFAADQPGAWLLSCIEPGHAGAGEQLAVVYRGFEAARPQSPAARDANLTLWHYDLGRGREILRTPSGQDRAFDFTLSGGMMGSEVWTINGRQYPNTEPMRLRRGDRVRVRFSNMSMESHPMHLHGQSFKVVAVNGRRLGRPIVKDSVDVEAPMGSVEIEFTAENPGDWFLHCHKPMHMEGGMILLVQIE